MQHKEALNRLRALFRRDPSGTEADVFSGPTLSQQEPDLALEIARYDVSTPAWAAAGHSTD